MFTPQTAYLKHREAAKRAEEVRTKYRDLFWRQPNVWMVSRGLFEDENGDYIEVEDGQGGYTKVVGIKIRVCKKVPQESLPPEVQIPDMIEGVPIQIIERPYDFPVMGVQGIRPEIECNEWSSKE